MTQFNANVTSLTVALLLSVASFAHADDQRASSQHVDYRTVKIDGLDIFYREAGPIDRCAANEPSPNSKSSAIPGLC